ncbi:MAG: hypothetical protein M1829_001197 [Trizodia sp. TS-e1964]|nr:MAG: hypothetical protein M1829_001197 [Trizodia sp. TS-e1964]
MASPQRAASPAAVKRLLHELEEYQHTPNDALLLLAPIHDEDLFRWGAVMKGVPGSAYEGGLWELEISVPQNYPKAPPGVRFATQICHPNVHFKTGEICLDLLKASWTPLYKISATLTAVHQLLTDPEWESPLNTDVAGLHRAGDVVGAKALIRYYTHASRWGK